MGVEKFDHNYIYDEGKKAVFHISKAVDIIRELFDNIDLADKLQKLQAELQKKIGYI